MSGSLLEQPMPESANMFSSGIPFSFTRLMITCWTAEFTPKSPQPRHHQALSPVMSALVMGVIAISLDANFGLLYPADDPAGGHVSTVVSQKRLELFRGSRGLPLNQTTQLGAG